jgi:hypothetical protein
MPEEQSAVASALLDSLHKTQKRHPTKYYLLLRRAKVSVRPVSK